MTLYVFLFLLSFFFILCLLRLWRLCLPHHNPPLSRAGTMHTAVQRLRHRHAPHLIVQPAATPPPSHRLWGQHLSLCAPGARSKAGEAHRNG
jgi:hypothetical protein